MIPLLASHAPEPSMRGISPAPGCRGSAAESDVYDEGLSGVSKRRLTRYSTIHVSRWSRIGKLPPYDLGHSFVSLLEEFEGSERRPG